MIETFVFFAENRKDKSGRTSQTYQQAQQQSPPKNDKYGSWGPVYKNKQNFIDMHICWRIFKVQREHNIRQYRIYGSEIVILVTRNSKLKQ